MIDVVETHISGVFESMFFHALRIEVWFIMCTSFFFEKNCNFKYRVGKLLRTLSNLDENYKIAYMWYFSPEFNNINYYWIWKNEKKHAVSNNFHATFLQVNFTSCTQSHMYSIWNCFRKWISHFFANYVIFALHFVVPSIC